MSKIHSSSQVIRTALLLLVGVGIVGVIAQIIITINSILATNKTPLIKQAPIEAQQQSIRNAYEKISSQTQQIDNQNQGL